MHIILQHREAWSSTESDTSQGTLFVVFLFWNIWGKGYESMVAGGRPLARVTSPH